MADRDRKGRAARGTKIGIAKLTEPKAREIRSRYKGGGISQRGLAAEYGVSQRTILNIVKNRIWIHA